MYPFPLVCGICGLGFMGLNVSLVAAHSGSAARLFPFLCESREFFPKAQPDESEQPFEAGQCMSGPRPCCGERQIRIVQ